MKENTKDIIQWHPAFYASIQIEFLRNDVTKPEEIKTLLKEYEDNKSSKLYQAAIDVITRANWNAVKEVKASMCEALKELMAEEFQEQEERVTKQVTEQVTKELLKQLVQKKLAKGKSIEVIADELEEDVVAIQPIIDEIKSAE